MREMFRPGQRVKFLHGFRNTASGRVVKAGDEGVVRSRNGAYWLVETASMVWLCVERELRAIEEEGENGKPPI